MNLSTAGGAVMRRDPLRYVDCNLPGCINKTRRDRSVPVSVVFDGKRLRGLVCSPEHATELQRGWSTRDAYGADLLPVKAS